MKITECVVEVNARGDGYNVKAYEGMHLRSVSPDVQSKDLDYVIDEYMAEAMKAAYIKSVLREAKS